MTDEQDREEMMDCYQFGKVETPRALDEDWLTATISDSLDVDWIARDAARLILSRLGVTEIIVTKPVPCPKCKCPATAMLCDEAWAVYCNNDGTLGRDIGACTFEGPVCNTEGEAVLKWNAIAAELALVEREAEVERLREKIISIARTVQRNLRAETRIALIAEIARSELEPKP